MSSNVQSLPSVTTTQSGQERLRSIATHLVLILGALVVLFPIAWMISTSLKAPNQVKQFPPIWIPNPLVWENYVRAVELGLSEPCQRLRLGCFVYDCGLCLCPSALSG